MSLQTPSDQESCQSANIYRVPEHLQCSSTLKRSRKLQKRGPVCALRIQTLVVSYMAKYAGSDLMRYVDGQNRKFPLRRLARKARKQYVPFVSLRTIERWFLYWIENGITRGEERVKERNATLRNNKRGRRFYRRRNIQRRTGDIGWIKIPRI